MPLKSVSLDDKYTFDEGRVFITGTQALIRLTMMQRRRDLAAGLNTAGYVTGYRGSPLGTVDMEFWRNKVMVEDHHIHFKAGVNEDLAATAVWGTQQTNLYDDALYDGVFAIWYGKGPGVDRSGDAFRHANLHGTSPTGGVLAMAGDDPSGKSSTIPSQSEYALIDAWIPILAPSNVQELLDYGLTGWALSRFSGCWVAMKSLTDTMDSAASVDASLNRVRIITPDNVATPEGGLHIRWPDPLEGLEVRLQEFKIPAVKAFARANQIDRTVVNPPQARIGIVAAGKAWLDTLQALEDLGIDDSRAHELGIRVRKIGMPWPLEPEGLGDFAQGLDEIIVVDEKRPVIEPQVKELLYHQPADTRPRVTGKQDPDGRPAIPQTGELNADLIARVFAGRFEAHGIAIDTTQTLNAIEARAERVSSLASNVKRLPYYCAGCPHNISTTVPEGSQAAAGIGCHYMVTWMDRDTMTYTQMGAEGANWLGRAPFTSTEHIFVNIGDGTLFHSGTLAIRAAVASGANITFKILYNDAVAMTGGQPMDGPMTVPMVTQQMRAEGIERIALVAEDPDQYAIGEAFAPGTTLHHRDDFDQVQKDIRHWPGVSVLIYDQTCAAEKRRRRKRGLHPDPDRRAFINTLVCEGCGDCGAVSNCVALSPVETDQGRKRQIDQSACNKDFTCVEGFCPAFVTVEGGSLKKAQAAETTAADIPEPALPALDEPCNILLTGIGGTGVVTVGRLLAMAAHLEDKGVSVLDVAGLAQKNGAVFTHLRLAGSQDELRATRIGPGRADLLLGFDMVAAASAVALPCLSPDRSTAVVSTHRTMIADFTRLPDLAYPEEQLREAITASTRPEGFLSLDAHKMAKALTGDAIAANILQTGYAWQKGLIPLSLNAIHEAIRLNGVSVAFNIRAFDWGRAIAHDPERITVMTETEERTERTLDEMIDHLARDLALYQNDAYANRYKETVAAVRIREQAVVPGSDGLTRAVAQNLYKLMAYKDEYEVARLYTDGRFEAALKQQFEGGFTLRYHMAPPLVSARDPETGRYRKKTFGPWMKPAMKLLAALKGLRGTAFDIFGYQAERKAERQMIEDYRASVTAMLDTLNAQNYAAAVQISSLPEQVRGFGPVKDANVAQAGACKGDLMETYKNGPRKAAE